MLTKKPFSIGKDNKKQLVRTMGLTVIIGIVFREIVERARSEGWSRNTVGLYVRFTKLFQAFQWFHRKYIFEHLTLFP